MYLRFKEGKGIFDKQYRTPYPVVKGFTVREPFLKSNAMILNFIDDTDNLIILK